MILKKKFLEKMFSLNFFCDLYLFYFPIAFEKLSILSILSILFHN